MTNKRCMLEIHDLDLKVNLGWRKKERLKAQAILVNLTILLPTSPKACRTDRLEDTSCYAQLIAAIREQTGKQHFQMVEHLCYTIYQIAKPLLPKRSKLTVAVTKYPKITGLIGGVCFSYQDK